MPVVDSSAILSLDYKTRTRALHVTFVTGRRYRYVDVPPDLYRRFTEANSKGQFFNFHIRDRYEFEEVLS